MTQAIIANKTDSEIRTAVKTIFGAKNARVTRNGEIHVLRRMPNTDTCGWYLLGFNGSSQINDAIFYPDGSLNFGLVK